MDFLKEEELKFRAILDKEKKYLGILLGGQTFDKLYKLYDAHKSQLAPNKELKEKKITIKNGKLFKDMGLYHKLYCQVIKEIVETKIIPASDKNDSEYEDYPDFKDKDFNKKIFTKKEFRMFEIHRESSGIQNKCDTFVFETAPHQMFLKNFMNKESPYKGILLFHGVGVGKTCSAITIAESFRDVFSRKNKRTIILSSKNIQIGWKKTIFNPALKEEQCTGKVFLNRNIKTKRELNRLVKEYYELMAYQSFGNYVKRMIEHSVSKYPDLSKDELERKVISDYFSDRLFIIDEAHNLRDETETEKDMKNSVEMIEKVLRYSNNMRLVLLTATPMYNRSTEIVRLLNFLLLNDNREQIKLKEVFDKEGQVTNKGKTLIDTKSRGYISYLRGEDPNTFPIRLYPSELKKEDRDLSYSKNKNDSLGCIINTKKSPQKNIFNKDILQEDKLKFLELYGSPLNGYHRLVYEQAEKEIIMKYDLSQKRDILQIQDNNLLSQISNMVYPVTSMSSRDDSQAGLDSSKLRSLDTDDLHYSELYGKKGLANSFISKTKGNKIEYKYRPSLLSDDKHPFLDKDELSHYSSKIRAILDLIEKTDGIIFIYSYWIKSGVIPLILALEQNGHKKFSGENVLNYPEWNKSKAKGAGHYKMKREPLSFEGIPKSQNQGEFHQSRYMVIAGDGEKLSHKMEDELKIATSPENSDGKLIKVIVGSVVASEGIDLKRIRAVHIVDPWLHLNRTEQTIGRGIRYCSHGDLDSEEDKNVMIYLHSTYNHGNKETIDSLIYRYAEKKAIHIGEIEDILKRGAVDRFLFREANVITKKNVSAIHLQSPIQDSLKLTVKPYDKPYSKICSYLPNCNYNSELSKSEYQALLNSSIDDCNTNTINYEYSDNLILSVQKKIAELFQEMSIYSLDSIEGLIKDFYNLDKDIIYIALQRMISNKFVVFNRERDIGYLLYSGFHYIFQPFLLNDETIPLYYRTYPEVKTMHEMYLPKKKKDVQIYKVEKQYEPTIIVDVVEQMTRRIDNTEYKGFLVAMDKSFESLLEHPVCLSFEYDRLSFEDRYKLVIGYLLDIIPNKVLQSILEEQVIYYKDRKLFLSQQLTDKKSYKKYGFYVVFDSFPQFFILHNTEILPMNVLDCNDLLQSLNAYSKELSYKKRYDTKYPWGYMMKRKGSDPTKQENTFLKFNKDNKKSQYPPGPGNICIDNSQGFQKGDLEKYILDNFKEYNKEILSNGVLKEKYNDKKVLCDVLEYILRFINIKYRNNMFLTYDDVWLKFPPFST